MPTSQPPEEEDDPNAARRPSAAARRASAAAAAAAAAADDPAAAGDSGGAAGSSTSAAIKRAKAKVLADVRVAQMAKDAGNALRKDPEALQQKLNDAQIEQQVLEDQLVAVSEKLRVEVAAAAEQKDKYMDVFSKLQKLEMKSQAPTGQQKELADEVAELSTQLRAEKAVARRAERKMKDEVDERTKNVRNQLVSEEEAYADLEREKIRLKARQGSTDGGTTDIGTEYASEHAVVSRLRRELQSEEGQIRDDRREIDALYFRVTEDLPSILRAEEAATRSMNKREHDGRVFDSEEAEVVQQLRWELNLEAQSIAGLRRTATRKEEKDQKEFEENELAALEDDRKNLGALHRAERAALRSLRRNEAESRMNVLSTEDALVRELDAIRSQIPEEEKMVYDMRRQLRDTESETAKVLFSGTKASELVVLKKQVNSYQTAARHAQDEYMEAENKAYKYHEIAEQSGSHMRKAAEAAAEAKVEHYEFIAKQKDQRIIQMQAALLEESVTNGELRQENAVSAKKLGQEEFELNVLTNKCDEEESASGPLRQRLQLMEHRQRHEISQVNMLRSALQDEEMSASRQKRATMKFNQSVAETSNELAALASVRHADEANIARLKLGEKEYATMEESQTVECKMLRGMLFKARQEHVHSQELVDINEQEAAMWHTEARAHKDKLIAEHQEVASLEYKVNSAKNLEDSLRREVQHNRKVSFSQAEKLTGKTQAEQTEAEEVAKLKQQLRAEESALQNAQFSALQQEQRDFRQAAIQNQAAQNSDFAEITALRSHLSEEMAINAAHTRIKEATRVAEATEMSALRSALMLEQATASRLQHELKKQRTEQHQANRIAESTEMAMLRSALHQEEAQIGRLQQDIAIQQQSQLSHSPTNGQPSLALVRGEAAALRAGLVREEEEVQTLQRVLQSQGMFGSNPRILGDALAGVPSSSVDPPRFNQNPAIHVPVSGAAQIALHEELNAERAEVAKLKKELEVPSALRRSVNSTARTMDNFQSLRAALSNEENEIERLQKERLAGYMRASDEAGQVAELREKIAKYESSAPSQPQQLGVKDETLQRARGEVAELREKLAKYESAATAQSQPQQSGATGQQTQQSQQKKQQPQVISGDTLNDMLQLTEASHADKMKQLETQLRDEEKLATKIKGELNDEVQQTKALQASIAGKDAELAVHKKEKDSKGKGKTGNLQELREKKEEEAANELRSEVDELRHSLQTQKDRVKQLDEDLTTAQKALDAKNANDKIAGKFEKNEVEELKTQKAKIDADLKSLQSDHDKQSASLRSEELAVLDATKKVTRAEITEQSEAAEVQRLRNDIAKTTDTMQGRAQQLQLRAADAEAEEEARLRAAVAGEREEQRVALQLQYEVARATRLHQQEEHLKRSSDSAYAREESAVRDLRSNVDKLRHTIADESAQEAGAARQLASLNWKLEDVQQELRQERNAADKYRTKHADAEAMAERLDASRRQEHFEIARLTAEAERHDMSSSRWRDEWKELQAAERSLDDALRTADGLRAKLSNAEDRLQFVERRESAENHQLRTSLQQLRSELDSRTLGLGIRESQEADHARMLQDELSSAERAERVLRTRASAAEQWAAEVNSMKSEYRNATSRLEAANVELQQQKSTVLQAEAISAKAKAAESTVLQSALAEVRNEAVKGAAEKRYADEMSSKMLRYKRQAEAASMEVEDLERLLSEQNSAWQSAPLDGLLQAANGMMRTNPDLDHQALAPLLAPDVNSIRGGGLGTSSAYRDYDLRGGDYASNAAGRLPPSGPGTPRTPRGGGASPGGGVSPGGRQPAASATTPASSRAALLRAQAQELKGEMRRWQQQRPPRDYD